ncbi:hypothetical protein TetV_557 [Tetraselmis virus 1]|uniref:Uncharacterized protein n=1 Tax=Tetraselmis virus 1 TaxID=2060617 RepID=A0A2P0VPC4_9VIRU|nr:hypothetical protein QJ968_gp497 [Tetraselmis virus 1]AUF82639.1 hypothetical protein TetV_557 [Tetraselmis virus 1]
MVPPTLIRAAIPLRRMESILKSCGTPATLNFKFDGHNYIANTIIKFSREQFYWYEIHDCHGDKIMELRFSCKGP